VKKRKAKNEKKNEREDRHKKLNITREGRRFTFKSFKNSKKNVEQKN